MAHCGGPAKPRKWRIVSRRLKKTEDEINFLLNVFKLSTEIHAYLSLQTHETGVLWCGRGQEELSCFLLYASVCILPV